MRNFAMFVFVLLAACLAVVNAYAAESSSCALKDSEVKAMAARYIAQKYPPHGSRRWQYKITQRVGSTVTVVASSLPVTPDASAILVIHCSVEELSIQAPSAPPA